MCGIVGYIGKDKFDPVDIKILMLSNMWRGIDASGFFSPKQEIIKGNLRIDEFLSEQEIEPDNLFIGHVRKSTYANSTTKNKAHPFLIDDIIGVHNGSLTDYYNLKIDKYNDLKISTDYIDSELLIGALNVSDKILSEYIGAAALIWHKQTEPNKIYFYHDDKRPLFRGNKGPDNLFLSSTEESLKIIGCDNIKEVKEDIIYQATVEDGILAHLCKKVVHKPYKREYKANNHNRTTSAYYTEGRSTSLSLMKFFNPELFYKGYVSFARIDKSKDIFFNEVDIDAPKLDEAVIELVKIPDTSFVLCYIIAEQSFYFIKSEALTTLSHSIGAVMLPLDNTFQIDEDDVFAILKDFVINDEGAVLIADVFKIKQDRTIIRTNENMKFLSIQLLPLDKEMCEEVFNDIYENQIIDLSKEIINNSRENYENT